MRDGPGVIELGRTFSPYDAFGYTAARKVLRFREEIPEGWGERSRGWSNAEPPEEKQPVSRRPGGPLESPYQRYPPDFLTTRISGDPPGRGRVGSMFRWGRPAPPPATFRPYPLGHTVPPRFLLPDFSHILMRGSIAPTSGTEPSIQATPDGFEAVRSHPSGTVDIHDAVRCL